jgi:hypothetical protein
MRESLRRPGVTAALLFAAAAALSACTILREVGPHDEGLVLQAAARVSHGELPWRDFWWNYGPGQPLLLGGLFKAFGPSLLVWRIVRVAVDATVALLAWLLLRRAAPPWLALLGWLAVAGAMAWPTSPGPNPPALALTLGGVLLARRSPVGAGALAGLAVAFRPEVGVPGAIAVVLAGGGMRAALGAAGAALVTVAPFVALAPGDAWDDTLGFLGRQHLQRLPIPLQYRGGADPNKVLEFYLPVVLLAGTALWAGVSLARRRGDVLWLLAPLAAAALYLVGRPDEFHLLPLSALLAVGLALTAAAERASGVRWALVGVLALIAAHGVERQAGRLLHPPALAAVPGPAGDGVETARSDAAALQALLPRLRGATLLVAPPRFDRVEVGDPLLYVIAGKANPTRYDVMQPGVVTTAGVQREMVRDLSRHPPADVVRWEDQRALATEPNGSSRSSGVHLLDDWIDRHYRPAGHFGVYSLLTARP